MDAVILDFDLNMGYTGLEIISRFKNQFPKVKWYANSCSAEQNDLLIKAGCRLAIGKNLMKLMKVF